MSATLTKAPRTGTREAEQPSVAPPEKLYPARVRLDKVLADYQKAGTDLSDSQAHLSRSEIDEQSTLNNLELSDEEAGDRLAVSQRSIAIYRARVSNRESARTKLLAELKAAASLAHNELSRLCLDERVRRSAILRGRMIEAGRLVGKFAAELDTLLEHSGLIQEIRHIEIPSGSFLFCEHAEQIEGMARSILDGYELIEAKQKEII
jgi:hypothetical protein